MAKIKVGQQLLHFEDTGGRGPTLVFNHSFAMNGSMFAPQLEVFRSSYRCITWDQRGHGESPAERPFTFWDSARDCLALLDHLGIESASLIGTSQGGFIALRSALLAPERVRSLAILGSSAAAEAPEQKRAFEQLHAAFIGDEASMPPEMVLNILAMTCFGPHFDAEPWKRVWSRWPEVPLIHAFRALADRDSILDLLGQIHAPTLVLHGADDGSYAPSHGQAIAGGVANSKGFVCIDKGAHFLSLTNAQQVNAALSPFLEQQAG